MAMRIEVAILATNHLLTSRWHPTQPPRYISLTSCKSNPTWNALHRLLDHCLRAVGGPGVDHSPVVDVRPCGRQRHIDALHLVLDNHDQAQGCVFRVGSGWVMRPCLDGIRGVAREGGLAINPNDVHDGILHEFEGFQCE